MTDVIDEFRRADDELIAKARRNADNVAYLTAALGHERLAYNIQAAMLERQNAMIRDMQTTKMDVENAELSPSGTYRLAPDAAVWIPVDDWHLQIYRQRDGRIGVAFYEGDDPENLDHVDDVIFPRKV